MQTAVYIYSIMQRLLNSNGAVVGGAGVGQKLLHSLRVFAGAGEGQHFRDDIVSGAAVYIGDGAADGLQSAVDRVRLFPEW